MHLNEFYLLWDFLLNKNIGLQILDLKKKQENQVQLLKEKQKSDEAAKKLQEEIHFIKAQKVPSLLPSRL